MSTYQSAQRAREHPALKQINLSYLRPDSPLPLVVRPAREGVDLGLWAAANSDFIETYLLRNGAILFRDFGLTTVEAFEHFIEAVSGPLLDYSYRSTPRHIVSGRIYSSTEYPADQTIPLHNENSYTRNWPMKLSFFAVQVAETGGETPIADCRRIYKALPLEIRECFGRNGLMYVRNYGIGLDLPWQEVFQTSSKAVVEDFCRKSDMEFEWLGDDQLRTRQVCQVAERHPRTGEMVWFNQAHLFHVSSLGDQVRESLLASGEPPRNACYGDGSPIEDEALDEIRAAYDAETVVFSWQKHDVLLLDNMLAAHGRKPYRGTRKIVVGMGQSI